MKRILVVAAASLMASAAYAADAIVYEPAPAPIYDAPGFTWTGAYIGINAGYGGGKARADATLWDDVRDQQNLIGSAGLGITGSGFLGGVQAGYNWQSGSMIYGIETDIQWTNIKAEGSLAIYDPTPSLVFSGEIGSKIDWFGTTRLRIGYTPVERFMVYATGGIAYGKMSAYFDTNIPGFGGSLSDTKFGWAAGAGAEYAINSNWSLKSEYLYTDLGKWSLHDGPIGQAGLILDADADFRFHTVRVGLNYRF